MLSPADHALVERDPGLRSLSVLLDDEALCARLAGAAVARRYLRYKPGTACVLGLDVDGQPAFAVAYAPESLAKLDKTTAAAPLGSLLLVDRARGLLVARPPADRDLPALAALDENRRRSLARVLPDGDVSEAVLHQLAHKPQRRWVARLSRAGHEPVVLRAHRPADAARTVAAAQALSQGPSWTPRLLGVDVPRGLVATTWLAGRELHRMLADGTTTRQQLHGAGAAVGLLHAQSLPDVVPRSAEDDAADVRRAAAAVARIQPDLAARGEALAARVSSVLAEERPAPVPVHGDLSADQVVVADDGRTGLLDLDAAGAAEPALDLGGLVAALHAATVGGHGAYDVEATAGAVLEGYPHPVDGRRLQAHLSAALLRRAVEPFRLCRRGWPDQLAELLDRAEATCPAGDAR